MNAMTELHRLPNIGAVLSEKLKLVGIKDAEMLRKKGVHEKLSSWCVEIRRK